MVPGGPRGGISRKTELRGPPGAIWSLSFCVSFLGLLNQAPQTGWLKDGSALAPSSGGCQSKIKVSTGLVYLEAGREDLFQASPLGL